jgi:hypothetical protein
MKLRHDFVTNSSSSGFIVAFPIKVKTLDEMLDYVGPRWKAERVLKDCLDQEPLDLKDPNFDLDFDPSLGAITNQFIKWLEEGWSKSITELNNQVNAVWSVRQRYEEKENALKHYEDAETQVAQEKGFKSYDDYKDHLLRKEASELINKFKGNYIYYFVFSDESGENELEHGNTFGSLEYCQISHH